MELDRILEKDKPSWFDKVTCYIFEAVDRLHSQRIPQEDMDEIKKKVNEIWRKHNPLTKYSQSN